MSSDDDHLVATELAALLRQVEEASGAGTEGEDDDRAASLSAQGNEGRNIASGTQPQPGTRCQLQRQQQQQDQEHEEPYKEDEEGGEEKGCMILDAQELHHVISGDDDVQAFTQDIAGVLDQVVTSAGRYLWGMKERIKRETLVANQQHMKQQAAEIMRLHKSVHSYRIDLEHLEVDLQRSKQREAAVREIAIEQSKARSCRATVRLVLLSWRAYVIAQKTRREAVEGVALRAAKRKTALMAFQMWARSTLQSKLGKEQSRHQAAIEGISKEIVRKYEKELLRLRSEVALKQEELEREVAQRHRTKEELHRTFLKGWTSMNLEALALLGAGTGQQQQQPSSTTSSSYDYHHHGRPDSSAVTESPNNDHTGGFNHRHMQAGPMPYDEQPRPPLALEPAHTHLI